MPQLNEIQLLILSGAAQRDDRAVEAPPTLKPAVRSAVEELLKRGLLSEVRAASGMPAWRRGEALETFALIVTSAGLQAIGAMPKEPAGLQGS